MGYSVHSDLQLTISQEWSREFFMMKREKTQKSLLHFNVMQRITWYDRSHAHVLPSCSQEFSRNDRNRTVTQIRQMTQIRPRGSKKLFEDSVTASLGCCIFTNRKKLILCFSRQIGNQLHLIDTYLSLPHISILRSNQRPLTPDQRHFKSYTMLTLQYLGRSLFFLGIRYL